MSSPKLPTDGNKHPIPALGLLDGGAHTVVAGAVSARNATAFNAATKVVSVCPTVPVFIRFGGDTVTATTSDHYIPAGLYYDLAINADDPVAANRITKVAVLRADSEDGPVYFSEKA